MNAYNVGILNDFGRVEHTSTIIAKSRSSARYRYFEEQWDRSGLIHR